MRWPIRYQILLPFAAAMVLGLLAVSLLSAFLAARRAERQIDEQVRNLGRTLQESSFPMTDSVLDQMHGLTGAAFVLTDAAGKIRASSKLAPAHQQVAPVSRWQELRLGKLIEVDGTRCFVSSLAVASRGREGPLTLDIFYPERHWRASRTEAALPPLMIGGVTLVAFIAVATLIAQALGRPIASLQRQVARLAEGDFQTLPLPDRNDELRDLARAINRLAQQLAEMQQAISRAERFALLGQLSGGLAHHLRNDITGARMAVQLHQRHGCHADDESLAVALRQLQLTEQHLQQFLSAGQPRPPQRTRCDPWEIVQQVAQMLEPTCRHRKVDLDVEDRRDQRNTEQSFLEADPEQLRQALMNLTLNAVEAAGPGGRVRLGLVETATHVAARVIDSGPGVPDGLAERLFEPFATRKPEGIGLGLAVARQIAESHGGSLVYRREEDTTCFELAIPKQQTGEACPAAQSPTYHVNACPA
ncbi:MAG TPA: HAMP domain-containing sensor histidine kinase [Pirellulales bacterium]|nr:HAMP domain-containing sensor histidine kinase [Pirellulales bacterium]